MLHSRLLRFILPTKTDKMADSPKLFDYKNPKNLEAEVPGAQKIREPQNADNQQNDGEKVQNGAEKSQNGAESAKVSSENLELVPTDDFSLEPVIVVTKQEAHYTKGDLKLQKVTVTEDISVKYQHLFKKQTLPGKTVVTQIQKFEYKY